MTVLEYAAKFIQLSHYAPHLVPIEVERAQKFQLGLRPPILNKMLTPRYRNMAQCMNEALEHERWVVKGKRMRDDSATAGSDHRPSKKASSQPFRAPADKTSGPKKPQPAKTEAAKSGISIKERPKGNACLQCGVTGHFKRECPQLGGTGSQAFTSPPQPPQPWNQKQ